MRAAGAADETVPPTVLEKQMKVFRYVLGGRVPIRRPLRLSP